MRSELRTDIPEHIRRKRDNLAVNSGNIVG